MSLYDSKCDDFQAGFACFIDEQASMKLKPFLLKKKHNFFEFLKKNRKV